MRTRTVLALLMASFLISVAVTYGPSLFAGVGLAVEMSRQAHVARLEQRAQQIWRIDHPAGWNSHWTAFGGGPWELRPADQSGPEGDAQVYRRQHSLYLHLALLEEQDGVVPHHWPHDSDEDERLFSPLPDWLHD